MSKPKDDGGQAFPVPESEWNTCKTGMSLRDWFAGQAPTPTEDEIVMEQRFDRNLNPYNDSHKPKPRSRAEIIASLNYAYADAMLAERSKQ